MDLLQRLMKQFFELYRSMTPSARGTLIAVPLLVIGGFAILLWSKQTGSETALSYGKIYSTEEVIAAEQALMKANLTEFRRVGQRIMVPVNQVDRYNAALVELDAMPSDLGSQMLKHLESMGPFTTDKQRQEMKEAMLLQEMRRMLRAVPDIEDARVVVANSGRRGSWSQKSRVTATVEVKPRGGRELSQNLVHALRTAVASMVPDLQPADVTIFDRVHGISFTGDAADDPFDSKLLQRIREFTQLYERKIAGDLGYIPNVGVTVQVDVENVKSSVTRSQLVDPKNKSPLYESEVKAKDDLHQAPARTEAGVRPNQPAKVQTAQPIERTRKKEDGDIKTVYGVSFKVTEEALIAAMPKAVQVSVSIPHDYYNAVAAQRKAVAAQRKAAGEQYNLKTEIGDIETEVLAAVQKSVKKLVPVGAADDAVVVKSVDIVEKPAVEPAIPWMERILQGTREWGGTIGLAMFAAWVLWQLRKLSPPTPAADVPEVDPFDAKQMKMPGGVPGENETEEQTKPMTRREAVQTIVKDNPEMTAAVIGKWLQQAAR